MTAFSRADLPVGKADVVRDGAEFKSILLYPSGVQNGPEEVLIVLQGAHQAIPAYQEPAADEKVYMGPAASRAGKPPLGRLYFRPMPTACARSTRKSARWKATSTARAACPISTSRRIRKHRRLALRLIQRTLSPRAQVRYL